jgi:drug/metabolite transporter (DMT)-like permease
MNLATHDSTTGSHRLRLFELHSAALLFGLTGVFGKYIHASPLLIVFGRSAFASASLGVYLLFKRQLSLRVDAMLIVSGLVLAVHWLTFFQSVQVSTVAVAVLTFSTSPVFSTLIEPWVFKERWRPASLIPVVLGLAGVFCMTPSFHLQDRVVLGAVWGTASGLSFSIYTMMNRLQVRRHSPQVLSFGQNTVAAVALVVLLPVYIQHVGVRELSLLATLGILCTAIGQSLYISSLRGVSAQLACIVSTLESPYGILFAVMLLGEIPTLRTIVGGVVILAAAVVATWMQVSSRRTTR